MADTDKLLEDVAPVTPMAVLSPEKARTWRIVTLVAGLLSCLVSGTLYGFGSWAPTMKLAFGWSQDSINLIGSLGDIGLYVAFTMGFLYDKTSPWITMLVGGSLQGIGYVLMALSVSGTIPLRSDQWGAMAFFLMLTGQGSFATFTAGYMPSLYNHHGKYRSRIMGLMVASFAASSMIFAVVFRYQFRLPETATNAELRASLSNYLFMLAGTLTGVSYLCAFLLRKIGPVEEVHKDEKPLLEDVCADVKPLYLFTKLDFWLVWLCMFCITGPGLLWINVQGSIAKSLNDAPAADYLVLILGAGNVAGRLVSGFASDFTATRLSRAFYFAPSAALMALAHIFFAFFQTQLMYVSCFATGFSYGIAFAVGTTLMTSLFGKRYGGTNVAIASLAPALSGIAFGQINGVLYSEHAVNNECVGYSCFKTTFVISGCVAIISIALSLWLGWRTPPFGRATAAESKPLVDNESKADDIVIDSETK